MNLNKIKILGLLLVVGVSRPALGILPESKAELCSSLARLVSVTASSLTNEPNRLADFFANASRAADEFMKNEKKGHYGEVYGKPSAGNHSLSRPHELADISYIANALTACCDVFDEYSKKTDTKKQKPAGRTRARKAVLTLLALTEGISSVVAAYGFHVSEGAHLERESVQTTRNALDVAAFASILHAFIATDSRYKKAMHALVMLAMLDAELTRISIAALNKYKD